MLTSHEGRLRTSLESESKNGHNAIIGRVNDFCPILLGDMYNLWGVMTCVWFQASSAKLFRLAIRTHAYEASNGGSFS
ncbi:hypothetical protein M514_08218 [Trichuris suis]|uniref:Uncharacterized protein n=1 Tax=Trichuris suis TaxID=68888 RepID=A0A085N789_9BILA|nr:hypothetical protein M513_08218 [Trichuris suis]KFD65335.1 hypothetical protein M514_08218 [Trichuris suis]